MIIFANWNLYTNYFDKEIDKNKLKKITYSILLIFYIIMILNMTIFDRHMHTFVWQGWDYYYKYGGINIIPFRTILMYFIDIKQYWPRLFIINIFGNILVFMPIQYFMIKVFGKLSFKKYLLIDIIMISLIEILQFVTSCGSLDIDDLILNVLGMSIVYVIIMDKHKILLNHKDKLVTSFISLIITFISFEILSWYHFGDIPTIRVFFRLIIGFMVIECIIYYIYKQIKKKRKS